MVTNVVMGIINFIWSSLWSTQHTHLGDSARCQEARCVAVHRTLFFFPQVLSLWPNFTTENEIQSKKKEWLLNGGDQKKSMKLNKHNHSKNMYKSKICQIGLVLIRSKHECAVPFNVIPSPVCTLHSVHVQSDLAVSTAMFFGRFWIRFLFSRNVCQCMTPTRWGFLNQTLPEIKINENF